MDEAEQFLTDCYQISSKLTLAGDFKIAQRLAAMLVKAQELYSKLRALQPKKLPELS
jgi:hypothetical protein